MSNKHTKLLEGLSYAPDILRGKTPKCSNHIGWNTPETKKPCTSEHNIVNGKNLLGITKCKQRKKQIPIARTVFSSGWSHEAFVWESALVEVLLPKLVSKESVSLKISR